MEWLQKHGPIRVAYQDNYLAFCAKDEETGELTGVLKDFLEDAADCFANAHIDFETVAYPTAAAALEALTNHEVDCVFPANFSGCDGEEMDIVLTPETMPEVPEGAAWDSTFLRYTFDGVDRQAAWLSLCNGMRLNVTVPVDEMEGDWRRLVWQIIAISAVILLGLTAFVLFYTGRITRPLQELTEAARQVDKGNYDFNLPYDRDDEVGRLTATFKHLANHMKEHITDLNKRAYVDSLTSVRNKGAFADTIEELQTQMDSKGNELEYMVGVFDCDDLKSVNDQYGHDKGDIYLKTACRVICHVFQHSPVFRIGGDEFAVILQNEDFENRDELIVRFQKAAEEISERAENPWEKVGVAMGIAVYDADTDHSVIDTVRRADKAMYMEKRRKKAGKA